MVKLYRMAAVFLAAVLALLVPVPAAHAALTGLPDKARALGLHVIEMPGWEGRGEQGAFDAQGILLHHDAMGLGYVDTDLSNNMNVPEYMSQDGVNGSQLWIGLDTEGQMSLVFLADGLKWHAGQGGGFRGIPGERGNATLVGIETDHTTGTGWSDEMVHYIDVTTQMLVTELGIDPEQQLAGHLEYTQDTGRKSDPEGFDLDAWRGRAAAHTPWQIPAPAPAPVAPPEVAVEPPPPPPVVVTPKPIHAGHKPV